MNVVIINITTKQKRKENANDTDKKNRQKRHQNHKQKKNNFETKKIESHFSCRNCRQRNRKNKNKNFQKKVTTQSAKMQQTQRAAIDKRTS